MDMVLMRVRAGPTGIFSYLRDELGAQVACTVEHAYPATPPLVGWRSKIPSGRYLCVRGLHRLALGDGTLGPAFETFEITGVPDAFGCLFHTGNTEYDSHGCVLPGKAFGALALQGRIFDAVLDSRDAFAQFMLLQQDTAKFFLDVGGLG